MKIVGTLVVVLGIANIALSFRFVGSKSGYVPGAGRRRTPMRAFPFAAQGNRRVHQGLLLFGGVMLVVVGAMWIAGIGTK